MAVPTSREAFDRDRWNPEKEFVPRLCPVWAQYDVTVLRTYTRERRRWKRLGAAVVEDATFAVFRERLKRRDRFVAVLFAHWSEDAVEFADRIVPVSEIISAVPTAFSGVLDLCVCHPEELALGLRDSHPNILVKYLPRQKATPALWMSYYSIFLELLVREPRPYLAAIEATTKLWLGYATEDNR